MQRTSRRQGRRLGQTAAGAKHRARADARRRSRRINGDAGRRRVRVGTHPGSHTASNRRSDPRFTSAVKNFEAATRFFRRQKYAKARLLFEKVAAEGPVEIAERARMHLRLCEQKTAGTTPSPKNATEYYHLGIAALNSRRLEAAIDYLRKADRAAPRREEIRYALAAAFALLGNPDSALEHLKAAIELRPGNRFQARQDEDFQSLAADLRFRRLTQPEPLRAPLSPY